MPSPDRSSACGIVARPNTRNASRVLRHSKQSQP
ncbi:unnamed protein product [Callosobruchus maculatus]|uniref:Uncharacterized protein n=1 Tax=Callosobruchus maculatus TaxID=64391 RepID=A0A653CQ56_CALMS|nr:unnamed protein product [Callosobruchus maculatus]